MNKETFLQVSYMFIYLFHVYYWYFFDWYATLSEC